MQRTVLDNGLRVLCTPMAGLRSASVALFFGVGSRFEDDASAGISHLTEHMLFKGTVRRPRASDIAAALESVGGILNASTDKEATMYWAKAASEHLPLAVDLLGDMVQNSLLRTADVARERDVIAEELRMIADDPQDWVYVLADELLWPGMPLGREIAGSHGTVSRFRPRHVRAHMDEYYGPNNAVMSIAGGIDVRRCLDLVERGFGSWKPVGAPPPPPASIAQLPGPWRFENKNFEQLNLCVAYPGVPREHVDRAAVELLTTILGGGASSRLFQGLRERRGLAYDVSASAAHYRDTGSITVAFGTEPPKSADALESVFREIERLRRRRVLPEELRRAKQFFHGRLWLGLEDTNAVAGWFGSQELLQDKMITPEEAVRAVDAVRASDVLRVAQTYLNRDASRVSAVGPTASLTRDPLPRGA